MPFRYDNAMLATWIASIAGELPQSVKAIAYLDESADFVAHCVGAHVQCELKDKYLRGGEEIEHFQRLIGKDNTIILCATQLNDFVLYAHRTLSENANILLLVIRDPGKRSVMPTWCLEAEGIGI